jgi:hypothetical protein
MAKHQTLAILGCGGCGTNIARLYQNNDTINGPKVSYYDTSVSNLNQENEAQAYLIEGTDGSGMKRDLNVEPMRKNVAPALKKFSPGDFNIVVFSASGGTGSVFGPLILDELLTRGVSAMVAVVGDTDSAKATENTLGTLRTLSALSAKHKTSIPMIYSEMAPGAQRRDVDKVIHDSIKATQLLTNGQNAELDSQDIVHWMCYERVTSHPPALSILNIYDANDKVSDLHGALSVASLYSTTDEAHATVTTAYKVKGYTNAIGPGPLHFVLTQEGLASAVEKLERSLKEHKAHDEAIRQNHVTLHDSVSTSGDFLQF